MRALCRIRREPYYRAEAFRQGLQKVGFKLIDAGKPAGADDWLILWNRQGAAELEADAWEKAGGTVIVAENGYLQKVDKSMYAISVHGHNGSGWFPVGAEDRFKALGFPLKEPRPAMGPIMVCGQRGIGSRTMRSPPQWAEKMVKRVQAMTKWPVHLRPHPGNFAPKVPLERDLLSNTQCVIWSSAAGVRAIVEGLAVFYDAPHWICEQGARRFPGKPQEPVSLAERWAALQTMAHGQWKHEEIATGEPFARIVEQRARAIW